MGLGFTIDSDQGSSLDRLGLGLRIVSYAFENLFCILDTQSLRSFRGIINESDIESNHGDDKDEPFTNDHDSDKEIFSEAASSMQGEIENNCPDQKPSSTPEQSPEHSPMMHQTDEVIDLNQSESNKTIVQRDTFFNVMQHTFEGVNLERNTQSGLMEIPTEPFLLASGDFLPILDKLGSKAFQPVKMDIRHEFYFIQSLTVLLHS